jgi:8-oxo-dGTP pyrophosphatase MutT (NUDIX family)
MNGEEISPWQTHETRVVYDNPWIQVREDRVTQPAGGPGIYGVVHMKHVATGVVALEDDGRVWLVGQWRYTLNAYSWEIPEGGAAPGEEPLTAIQRELREETGLEAQHWKLLQIAHTSNCVTDEVAYIYLARGLRRICDPDPEPTEQLRLQTLPLEEALDRVARGEIRDAVSVIGLLRAAQWLAEQRPG